MLPYVSINNCQVLNDLATSFFREALVYKDNISVASVWMEALKAMKAVVKVKTFRIIVLQGLVGSLPWTSMVFFTLWFQLIGEHLPHSYSHFMRKNEFKYYYYVVIHSYVVCSETCTYSEFIVVKVREMYLSLLFEVLYLFPTSLLDAYFIDLIRRL